MAYLSRIEYLVGPEKIQRLKEKKVMLCGCGGVGSFVAEALCRSGLGHIVLVDHDVVDPSNLNRQLMTDRDNIGMSKVEALAQRLEKVSDTQVETIDAFIDENFALPEKYDYVVDCIDTLTCKYALVRKCHEAGIPVLSSLGSARRLKPENIRLTTLDRTRNDPLAKAFRNIVKKDGYRKKIEVVYVDTPAMKTGIVREGDTHKEKYPLASGIFVVGSVGLFIAETVFERLTEE